MAATLKTKQKTDRVYNKNQDLDIQPALDLVIILRGEQPKLLYTINSVQIF